LIIYPRLLKILVSDHDPLPLQLLWRRPFLRRLTAPPSRPPSITGDGRPTAPTPNSVSPRPPFTAAWRHGGGATRPGRHAEGRAPRVTDRNEEFPIQLLGYQCTMSHTQQKFTSTQFTKTKIETSKSYYRSANLLDEMQNKFIGSNTSNLFISKLL
jgi:hypothetical protein